MHNRPLHYKNWKFSTLWEQHEIVPCYSVLLIQKNRKRGEFLAFIYCSKMQKCLSFWGLRPLDPHQGSALDPLGGLQRPQTPSCVQQWPTVIASCACGATPDPVSGNNWVITKYASQFFKAGYGPVSSNFP